MENDSYPLISILITSFNNSEYIYDCLESVLCQTYPNLEIIIGDDGSDYFPIDNVKEWLQVHSSPNVKSVSFLLSKENQGTVKNYEDMESSSKGEFLFRLSADDVLSSSTVILSLYNRVVETDSQVGMAQIEMWDEMLTCKISNFVSPDIVELISSQDYHGLFANLCHYGRLAASYLYKREVIQIIGLLSDHYRIIEDYPCHIRMVLRKVRIAWLDTEPSIKHRDGGISTGHSKYSNQLFLRFYYDNFLIYENEIEPHLDLLSVSERRHAILTNQEMIECYYGILVPQAYKIKDLIEETADLPKEQIKTIKHRALEKYFYDFYLPEYYGIKEILNGKSGLAESDRELFVKRYFDRTEKKAIKKNNAIPPTSLEPAYVFINANNDHNANIKTMRSVYAQHYENINLIMYSDNVIGFEGDRFLPRLAVNRKSNIRSILMFENRYSIGLLKALQHIRPDFDPSGFVVFLNAGNKLASSAILPKIAQLYRDHPNWEAIRFSSANGTNIIYSFRTGFAAAFDCKDEDELKATIRKQGDSYSLPPVIKEDPAKELECPYSNILLQNIAVFFSKKKNKKEPPLQAYADMSRKKNLFAGFIAADICALLALLTFLISPKIININANLIICVLLGICVGLIFLWLILMVLYHFKYCSR